MLANRQSHCACCRTASIGPVFGQSMVIGRGLVSASGLFFLIPAMMLSILYSSCEAKSAGD